MNFGRNSKMTRVDEINAQIAKLEAEREEAMLTLKISVKIFVSGSHFDSLRLRYP